MRIIINELTALKRQQCDKLSYNRKKEREFAQQAENHQRLVDEYQRAIDLLEAATATPTEPQP